MLFVQEFVQDIRCAIKLKRYKTYKALHFLDVLHVRSGSTAHIKKIVQIILRNLNIITFLHTGKIHKNKNYLLLIALIRHVQTFSKTGLDFLTIIFVSK